MELSAISSDPDTAYQLECIIVARVTNITGLADLQLLLVEKWDAISQQNVHYPQV